MKQFNIRTAALMAAIVAAFAAPAQATIVISEVNAWSSGNGNSPYRADWFELTNTGASTVNISGWKVDDNSNSFAAALALTGLTSIAAGQSVVFIEVGSSTTAAAVNASFSSTWFGATPPSNFVIGNYSGAGIGLGQGGDAVNIYDAAGTLQANVTFGASDDVTPRQTFDNAAGLNNTVISQLSVEGVNGAFVAVNDINEIGSPGSIAPVPEPSEYAMLLAGLVVVAGIARRRGVQFS